MAITRTRQPEKKVFRNLPLALVWVSASAALLVSPCSNAASWKIAPSLNLSESYSDNVNLASSGAKKDDFITQVNPGISIVGTGSHLKADASYTMQNLVYAEKSGQDTTRHQLNANANAELVDNLLYLDGRATISQQNTSIFGSQATNNTNVAGNRTEVKTYNVSPFLRNHFGNFAASEIRYTHSESNTGIGGLSDSQMDSIQLDIKNGSSFKTLGWGLNYNNEKATYTNLQDLDREAITGNLRYLITPRFGLAATGGYERNNYVSIGSKPEGSSWSAGVFWAPSSRTSLEASTGQRFFGKTYALNVDHRARSTAWNLGYSEDITTTQSQFQSSELFKIPATEGNRDLLEDILTILYPGVDPALRRKKIDDAIERKNLALAFTDDLNYLTNRVFLQKRLQASVAMTGARNTLVLSLFNSSREAQTAQSVDSTFGGAMLSLSDKTKQIGGNAVWSWRINSRTGVNFSAGYSRNSSSSLDRTDSNKNFQVGMTRQFQPKLSGMISLRRNQQSTSGTGGGYQENAATASLSYRF